MPEFLSGGLLLAADSIGAYARTIWSGVLVVLGFSLIIFVHELGHFVAAKAMGIRVDRFAIGFFYRLIGYRRGEGITFGPREYTTDQVKERGLGETDYCINALPVGGYVKMLGEEDIDVDEKTGQIKPSTDPRAFNNKSIPKRMIVVSAGVIFNVLFAIVAYWALFTGPGMNMMAPVVGVVPPDGAVAAAGLVPGDRIVAVNGGQVESLEQVLAACLASSGKMHLTVQRAGAPAPLDLTLDVPRTSTNRIDGVKLGLIPLSQVELAREFEPESKNGGPQPGDIVTAVDGQPVNNVVRFVEIAQLSGGRPLEVTVTRPAPAKRGQPETFTLTAEPQLQFLPSDEDSASGRARFTLLGMAPRRVVDDVAPGHPAEAAGFKRGDVILQWGTVINPVQSDILEGVEANEGKPLDAVVLRDGKEVPLQVTPRRAFRWMGTAPVRVGITFGTESGTPVVADVIADSPAGRARVPKGATLTAIDGVAVASWNDVCGKLRKAAGHDVVLRYRLGSEEAETTLPVPPSIVSELNLSPVENILRIDGQDRIKLADGRTLQLPSLGAVRALLRERIGQTVNVDYASIHDREVHKASFTVTEDNWDPWQLRIIYTVPPTIFSERFVMERVRADGPVQAIAMAGRQTVRVLEQMYLMLRAMLQRQAGMENVSGPIGIFGEAVNRVEMGYAEFLGFLALVSVNLAVLNFLPLPVVDGGLMVFLILEWIRRKPLSFKVQVATTLTGLALIVLCFIFVTIQDLSRLLG